MNQRTIDRAVNIATRAALRGNPVAKVIWIPPQSAASDPDGSFIINYAGALSTTETPPWE